MTTAFMLCHSSVFEGLECSLGSKLWCCPFPGQRYYTCPSVSFSPVLRGARVCLRLAETNDVSKQKVRRNLSSFVSRSSECIPVRFWSPRCISDVALSSNVTTAFMLCHSSVFEGLECSLGSKLWCCSFPGQRYYTCPSVSFSPVLRGARVCLRLAETNDVSKQKVRRNLSSFVSRSSECIRAKFWFPRLISDVALCSAVTIAFMLCQSTGFEGFGCSLNANLWCCFPPSQRYFLVKLLHCSPASIPCSRTAGSFSLS